jgi:hypothetical protein
MYTNKFAQEYLELILDAKCWIRPLNKQDEKDIPIRLMLP